jgi:hypothetical protein
MTLQLPLLPEPVTAVEPRDRLTGSRGGRRQLHPWRVGRPHRRCGQAVGRLGGTNRGEGLPRRHPDPSARCWPIGSSACQDRRGGSLLAWEVKWSRVRPMVEPAVGEIEKRRIVVRSLSGLLRAGATGVGCSLGASSGRRTTRFVMLFSSKLCRLRGLHNGLLRSVENSRRIVISGMSSSKTPSGVICSQHGRSTSQRLNFGLLLSGSSCLVL